MSRIPGKASVSAESLSKYTLRELTFHAEAPGALLVLGPNGSCKTTLLRLIAGVLKPERGRVRVMGADPFRDHWVRGFVSFAAEMPQADALETPAEYLRFYAATSPREVRGSVEDAAEQLGLRDLLRKRLHELSAGQRKRVELAKLLVRRAPIMLADEPTMALDVEYRDRVLRLLKNLSEESLLVVATHDTGLVSELGGAVLTLGGQVKQGAGIVGQTFCAEAKAVTDGATFARLRELAVEGVGVEVEVDVERLLSLLGVDIKGAYTAIVARAPEGLPAGARVIHHEGPVPVKVKACADQPGRLISFLAKVAERTQIEDLRVGRQE